MRFATAVLIKHRTEDGLMELCDNVPLGREYEVDMDSRKRVKLFNAVQEKVHRKEVIGIIEDGKFAGWMPMELLVIKSRVLQ